jgi:hypothetical protein
MTNKPGKGFLIAVLVFGLAGTAAGVRWLAKGEIVIREGRSRTGVGGRGTPSATPQGGGRVAGHIRSDHALYYPLCVTWVGLGVSMITFAALSFFSSNGLYPRLAAYSLAAVLPLGFGTLAAALWAGP